MKVDMRWARNRSRAIVLVGVLAMAGAIGGVFAASWVTQTNRVRDLIETRECLDCDLQRANLERLDLRGVDLQGADLRGANLQGARLGKANLQRADLRNSNLEGVDFGCQSYSLSVEGDQYSQFGVRVDSSPIAPVNPQQSPPGFNLSTTDNSATLRLNLGGCADLQGANLRGARLPDGSVQP